MKLLLVILAVLGTVWSQSLPEYCLTSLTGTTDGVPGVSVFVVTPSLTQDLETSHTYSGAVKISNGTTVNNVIVQARPARELTTTYGHFPNDASGATLNPGRRCFKEMDTLVTGALSPGRYEFSWTTEPVYDGEVHLWCGVQYTVGSEYIWYLARILHYGDTDIKPTQDHEESTVHKIHYIALPAILLLFMIILIIAGAMVFNKVKNGTICFCSSWGSPIAYRYARKYRVHRRPRRSQNNPETASTLPPSYDTAIEEENRIARQNVAQFEIANLDTTETDSSLVVGDDQALLGEP